MIGHDKRFNVDFGLGLCMQCVADFKSEENTRPDSDPGYPAYACCMVPIMGGGPPVTVPVCYGHVEIGTPPPPPPPMSNGLLRAQHPIPQNLFGIDQGRIDTGRHQRQ